MSSELQALLDRGADSVGGDLMLNQKVVGHLRGGEFIVTPDGAAELAVEDVAFVEVVATEVLPVTAKKPGKKAKAVESEPEVAPAESALSDELDSLLAPVPDA
jgi:hypothetical protein